MRQEDKDRQLYSGDALVQTGVEKLRDMLRSRVIPRAPSQLTGLLHGQGVLFMSAYRQNHSKLSAMGWLLASLFHWQPLYCITSLGEVVMRTSSGGRSPLLNHQGSPS